MITTRITLTNSKEAVEVDEVPEGPIVLRVRKITTAAVPNGDFSDLAIQVQAYRVDANGAEIDAGPVTGRTLHGGGMNPDMPSLVATLTSTAILGYVSKWIADHAVVELPDELV